MVKHKLTGQNLGQVFKSRCGCMNAMQKLWNIVVWPNLELRTQSKQVFGSLLLNVAFPAMTHQQHWWAQKQWEILKIVWAKFSTLSEAFLLWVQLYGIYKYSRVYNWKLSPGLALNSQWLYVLLWNKIILFISSYLFDKRSNSARTASHFLNHGPIWGRLLASPTNIRLSWKGLWRTNTLAYLNNL
jgi:hypothetical protein